MPHGITSYLLTWGEVFVFIYWYWWLIDWLVLPILILMIDWLISLTKLPITSYSKIGLVTCLSSYDCYGRYSLLLSCQSQAMLVVVEGIKVLLLWVCQYKFKTWNSRRDSSIWTTLHITLAISTFQMWNSSPLRHLKLCSKFWICLLHHSICCSRKSPLINNAC